MHPWSRADKLQLVGVILGIIALVGSLGLAPSYVPEIAVVMSTSGHNDPGISVVKTRFQNSSLTLPIQDFEATWEFSCSKTSLATEGEVAGVQLRCDPQGSRAILTVSGFISARAWLTAVFSRLHPFFIPAPEVKASHPRIGPSGVVSIPVEVMSEEAYREREEKTNRALIKAVLVAVGAIVLLFLFIRRMT